MRAFERKGTSVMNASQQSVSLQHFLFLEKLSLFHMTLFSIWGALQKIFCQEAVLAAMVLIKESVLFSVFCQQVVVV